VKKEYGAEMEMLGPESFLIGRVSKKYGAGTIECILLISCYTPSLGIELTKKGVPCLLAKQGHSEDGVAAKFAE